MIYACDFSQGQWRPAEWRMVQSPRWDRGNEWIQEVDHIRNDGPEQAPGETYTSMVLQQSLRPGFVVHATMSFDDRMAPLLVVGAAPTRLRPGCWQYGEHFEVVLFDEGINLWHHVMAAGQPSWSLAQKWRFAVQANQRYRLSLTVSATRLDVALDGRTVGHHIGVQMPAEVAVGVTACEGINRFYDFCVDAALACSQRSNCG